ncbi:MAG: hypothetical protein V7L13_17255 [Nostoc sp.]
MILIYVVEVSRLLLLVKHISRIQILNSDVYDGLRSRDRTDFPS